MDNSASTSSPQAKPRSRTQNWRHKQKAANPTKYAEVQKQNKEYSKLYRLQCSSAKYTLQKRGLSAEEREEAEMWEIRHKRNNELARKRMEKMKEKKKAVTAAKKTQNKKLTTRNEAQQKRVKEKNKKRLQRAKMTKEQKEEEKRKNRERYAKKRHSSSLEAVERALEAKKQQLKEMETKLHEKEMELRERNKTLREQSSDTRSSEAKRKSLERARRGMPKHRAHFVSTTLDLTGKTTPRKAAALAAAGIHTTKDSLADGVMKAVAEVFQAPRQSKARKRLSECLSTIKRKKLLREASRRFGVSRKLLAKARKDREGRKPVSHLKAKLMETFYEAHSNPLPDKKFVSKKTGKPRYIMGNTIANFACRVQQGKST